MTAILITLAALAYLASGYAVNAGYFGLFGAMCPGFKAPFFDWIIVVANTIVGPLGFIVLALKWHEYGRQPFRWDWPWLLVTSHD